MNAFPWLSTLLVLSAAANQAGAAEAPPLPLHSSDLPAESRKQLLEHEVLSSPMPKNGDEPIFGARAVGIVYVPPRRVAESLFNLDAYPEFMPRVTHTRIHSRTPTELIADAEIDLPWPLANARLRVRFRVEKAADHRIRITCETVTSNLRAFSATATMSRWDDDPHKTYLVYETHVGIDTFLPDSMLSRSVRRYSEKVIHELRIRISQTVYK